MIKTKIKNIRKITLMLMGGATLISVPLAITSCSTDNWKWTTQSFSDAETMYDWANSLMVPNNKTKTIHTRQEYASFFYNDLNDTNLFISTTFSLIVQFASNTIGQGNSLTLSYAIGKHKAGMEVVNQGLYEKVMLKITISKKKWKREYYQKTNNTDSAIMVNENGTFSKTSCHVTHEEGEERFGPYWDITINAEDAHNPFGLRIWESQFPNYTFQISS